MAASHDEAVIAASDKDLEKGNFSSEKGTTSDMENVRPSALISEITC
jgi:hypothetical protein